MRSAPQGFFNDIHDDGVTKSAIACSAHAHPLIAINFTTSSHRSQRMKELHTLKNRYLATHVGWLVWQACRIGSAAPVPPLTLNASKECELQNITLLHEVSMNASKHKFIRLQAYYV